MKLQHMISHTASKLAGSSVARPFPTERGFAARVPQKPCLAWLKPSQKNEDTFVNAESESAFQ